VAVNNPSARLPFETAPVQKTIKVGTDSTGILEFPVYHDLTVVESAWLNSNGSTKTAFTFTARLALKIAHQEKVKPIDAHMFVTQVLAAAMGAEMDATPEQSDWLVKYARELEETAMKVLEISVSQQNLLVTTIIKHRLQGMDDWAPTDTSNLPSELCEEIYKFALAEQSRGSYETLPDTEETLADMLGKLQTEATTARQQPSTGEPSTTSSENSAPEIPTTPESDSDPSDPETSSTP